jgi:hypothetical protein
MMVMPKEDVTQAEVSKQAERLKKSHIFLMKHPKIMALSGIIIMGTSEVRANIPTAYTDGVNKKYGAGFMASVLTLSLTAWSCTRTVMCSSVM